MLHWLSQLGIDTTGFDRWSLTLAGGNHAPSWVLAAAALICGALFIRSSVRDLASAGRRAFLIVLQALTLLLIVAVMLQPAIRLAKVTKLKDRVAVLIDDSASMSLASGEKGLSRAGEAHKFLADNQRFFAKLEDEFIVTFQSFDAGAHDLAQMPEAELESKGDATDLMAAVSAAAGSGGTAPLAGAVLITDGADTSRLGGLVRARGGAAELKGLLQDFPAPVNAVVCGRGGSIADLAIVDAVHDDYGFVHNPFDVLVEIRSEGGLASEVPVIFKQGSRVLATTTVSLAPGQNEAEATLSFTPRQVGEFMFSVEIPPVPGEVTEINNVLRFPLKVLRDKIRVLYIAGNPSWDARFLRQILKKDPQVDLVSFKILREHWDDYESRQEEVSLIPFPTEKLFMEELDTFDLVIWQNFRGPIYMPGRYPQYMAELNRFVRERGGALLMLGGRRGYFGQGRLDPKLLDLLPVVPGDTVPNYREMEVKASVTEAGRRHPIMRIGDGGEDPAAVWERLPALTGMNVVRRAVPDALVLAAHPFERTPGGDLLPLIAVREVGAGRVMAVMTDNTWEWSFTAAGLGLSTKPYQRFWENSLRWLLQDPEMRLVSLAADRGRVKPGEPVTIVIEVLDETYNPTDAAELKVEIEDQPEGADLALPAPERIGTGKYRLAVAPQAAGGYRLRASARLGQRTLGHNDAIFEAADQSVEWFDVVPRPEIPAAIALATGGASIAADESPSAFAFKRLGKEQIVGSRDVPLWDNGVVFLALFAMMVTAWFLRRRWGLR